MPPDLRALRGAILAATIFMLAACGTTYSIPKADSAAQQSATRMFADARSTPRAARINPTQAQARFHRVIARVSPVASRLCREETASVQNFNCNVRVEIDAAMRERNAYFTYAAGRPTILMSMPILQDTASDDEVAFVLSHEYGHLIARHIQKQQQQQIAGALILGTIAAAANAQAAANGTRYDPRNVDRGVELGAAIGGRAYSQTFELESDMLGARIATAAGYDAVQGARYFARPEQARSQSGANLSFWGTHPPNEKRLATVIATKAQIDNRVALTRQKN